MLTDQQSAISLTLASLHGTWCAYEVQTSGVVIFVGVSRLAEVFQLSDARRNLEFEKMVKTDTPLIVNIVRTGTRSECFNYRTTYVRKHNPYCNRVGMNTTGIIANIVCTTDNDRTFATQTEAAQFYKINQGQLSSHLAGRPGFASVKGHKFRRDLR